MCGGGVGAVPRCALTSGRQGLERGREQVDAQQLLERARRRLQRLVVTHRAAAAVVWLVAVAVVRLLPRMDALPPGDVARQELHGVLKSRDNSRRFWARKTKLSSSTGRSAEPPGSKSHLHSYTRTLINAPPSERPQEWTCAVATFSQGTTLTRSPRFG